jgi:hypothetical protein
VRAADAEAAAASQVGVCRGGCCMLYIVLRKSEAAVRAADAEAAAASQAIYFKRGCCILYVILRK